MIFNRKCINSLRRQWQDPSLWQWMRGEEGIWQLIENILCCWLLTSDHGDQFPRSPVHPSQVLLQTHLNFILNSLRHMTWSFLVSTINKDLKTASVLVQRFLFRHWSWIIVTPEHSYHALHSTLKNLICENTLMSFISPRWIVPLVLNWQNLFNILTFYSDLTHWQTEDWD